MVISQRHVEHPVGDGVMRTFVAAPRTPGPHPGIAFFSDIFQLTESTERWCARLAGYGFVVAAPEIYHSLEPAGTVLAFDDAGKARGQRDAETMTVAGFDAVVAQTLELLESTDSVDGARLGAAGHCTGGHVGFRAAFDPRVRATALWYATGLHDGKLAAEPDAGSLARAAQIQGTLLTVFGSEDPHTPVAGRDAVRAALEAAGVDLEWLLLPAAHAFGRDVGERWDPEMTDRAFAATVAALRRL